MTSPRPYRESPLSVEDAIAELRGNAGTQFDAQVVQVFCDQVLDPRPTESRQRAAARA